MCWKGYNVSFLQAYSCLLFSDTPILKLPLRNVVLPNLAQTIYNIVLVLFGSFILRFKLHPVQCVANDPLCCILQDAKIQNLLRLFVCLYFDPPFVVATASKAFGVLKVSSFSLTCIEGVSFI